MIRHRVISSVLVALLACAVVAVPTTGAATADRTLTGTGTGVHTVTLDKGLTVFDYSVTGTSSNFIVWFRGSNNATIGLVANVIGDAAGTIALRAPSSGEYRLDVTHSNSSWSITARQPRATTAPSTRSWNGTGESVTELFYLKAGTYQFDGVQDGRSNFIVHLVDLDGATTAFLANVIGDDPTSKVFVLRKSGVYVLTVDADGTWNASIAAHRIPYRLSSMSVPRTARANSWFNLSARITPKYLRLSSTPVTIRAQRKSGSRWVSTMSVRLSGTDYSSYTLYRARMKVSRGTWRAWAEFKDAEHGLQKTGYKYVTVR
ncbi:MAG: hypothetical protein U1E26_08455 [Coriobacteriia bacterium]|nr:hypothetical protein [Coriobacteriia bacterium]